MLFARCACALLLACAPAFAAPKPKAPTLTLVYDHSPAACDYLLNLYNRDLARKGYVDTRAHRVFQGFHWMRLTGRLTGPNGSVIPSELAARNELAFFDLTNSGHPVPVVRSVAYIGPDATRVVTLYFPQKAPANNQMLLHMLHVLRTHDVRATLPSPYALPICRKSA